MQKKIVALAVAGILAAPMAAQAGVEVYGKARLSAGIISNDDSTAGNDDSKLNITSHNSRLGFKGTEDLGGGLKAMWQIEREVDFSDKDDTLSTRNTFVGLGGDFGTVILGTHDTPYKMATGSLDPFVDTHGDYNSVIDKTADARAANVLAYLSPDMSGFSAAVAFVTDYKDDKLPDTTPSREQPAISLAGMYKKGPLDASLAYQSVSEGGVLVGSSYDDLTAVKLGLGYALNAATKVGFVYENVDMGGSNHDQSNVYVSGSHGLGNGMTANLAIGQKGDMGNSSDTGAMFFAVGVNKALSDKTEVYGVYSKIDSDNSASYNLVSGVGAAGVNGGAASAVAVGINMKFSSM